MQLEREAFTCCKEVPSFNGNTGIQAVDSGSHPSLCSSERNFASGNFRTHREHPRELRLLHLETLKLSPLSLLPTQELIYACYSKFYLSWTFLVCEALSKLLAEWYKVWPCSSELPTGRAPFSRDEQHSTPCIPVCFWCVLALPFWVFAVCFSAVWLMVLFYFPAVVYI